MHSDMTQTRIEFDLTNITNNVLNRAIDESIIKGMHLQFLKRNAAYGRNKYVTCHGIVHSELCIG